MKPPYPIDLTREEEARFWSKVEKKPGDGCWLWHGPKDSQGVGGFIVNGVPGGEKHPVRLLSHRVAFALTVGHDITPEKCVVRRCRTQGCVNPAHRCEGSMRDVAQLKAGRGTLPKGETHHRSRLTLAKVREIRRLCVAGWSLAQLARRFRTTPTNVSLVVRGTSWRDEGYGKRDWRHRKPEGERNPKAKLTSREVGAIWRLLRERRVTMVAIARKFRVRPPLVGRIARGETWRNHPDAGPFGVDRARKLTWARVREIRHRVGRGEAQVAVARSLGVSAAAVNHVVRRRSWAA